MKLKRLFLILSLMLCLGATCNTSQKRTAFNSVASLEQAVDSAYREYMDLVVTGKTPTNSVASISAKYDSFQGTIRVMVAMATISTNAPPTGELTKQATDILTSINAAKGAQ